MNIFQDFSFGCEVVYLLQYDFVLLFFILCCGVCEEIGLDEVVLLFVGYDCWQVYELSWLDWCGKLWIVVVIIGVLCILLNLIEFKLFKLYFNLFNSICFDDDEVVWQCMVIDLLVCVGVGVIVQFGVLFLVEEGEGELLDECDVVIDCYGLLVLEYLFVDVDVVVIEILGLVLFKFNCLVIGQLDWVSVSICYYGLKIDCDGLFRYLVSYWEYVEFYEQCVECIFSEISQCCWFEWFEVEVCYICCGGLDINLWCVSLGIVQFVCIVCDLCQ